MGELKIYRGWLLYDELPEGWLIDKTAGSPVCGYEFCTNGKNIITGLQKRALVRTRKAQSEISFTIPCTPCTPPNKPQKKRKTPCHAIDANDVRTVNELARQQFKLKLLIDMRADLMICEIEGWDKMEYINELKLLINSFASQPLS